MIESTRKVKLLGCFDVNGQLHILKRHLSRAAVVLYKFFALIFQKRNEKKNTKAITTKQAWCCKQKTPKCKGTRLRKENKFPAYFEPVFPFSSP